MLRVALSSWVAELKSSLKSRLWSYGMFGAAGFLLLCAAAHILDALHGLLASRYGFAGASLIIAAFLLLAACGCSLRAAQLGRARPHPTLASPVGMASLRPSGSTSSYLAAAGALSAALAAFGWNRWSRRHSRQ